MEQYDDYTSLKKSGKQHNILPLWGNEATMNLNPLILANIQGSSYFKVTLFKLKTYHEVVDEIYYQVKHLEPWERGSRKTAGQTGMCGGVRGVGAGGIVSTAFCLLYKLYTLRLTRKQVNGLLNHTDSPYIRALGFMYIRYTQPPADLYDWYEDYFLDEEEIDVKAGGGQTMTIGQLSYQLLTKLDWFSTLFPRIPVPIQKQIEKNVELYCRNNQISLHQIISPSAVISIQNSIGNNSGPRQQYPRSGNGSTDYDIRDEANAQREREYYPERRRRENERDYRETTQVVVPSRSDRDRDRGGGGASVSGYNRDVSRRDYNDKSRSRSKEHKHKRKHKHKERSRSHERRQRDYYKDKTKSSSSAASDKYKDRDYDRKYH